MAFDLHIVKADGRPGVLLHRMEPEEYAALGRFWELCRTRMGLSIDEYADTRISPPRIRSMIDALQEVLRSERNSTVAASMSRVLSLLQGATAAGHEIGFFGD